MLKLFSVRQRLCPTVQIVGVERKVLPNLEGKSESDPFIDRTMDISADTQRAKKDEVNLLVESHCQLRVVPDLRIVALRRRGLATDGASNRK